jgi:hypothetical protein
VDCPFYKLQPSKNAKLYAVNKLLFTHTGFKISPATGNLQVTFSKIMNFFPKYLFERQGLMQIESQNI